MAGSDAAARVDEVGTRILEAALQILRARGPRAVTMQAVVEATGIAKTTIYRRHPNRRALLTAALEGLVMRPAIPPESSREQRLRWVVSQSVDVIANGIGVGGFAALLTDEDPDFSEAFRAILGAHRGQAIEVLGGDSGDGDTVIDMIVGGYVAELARTGTVDRGWPDRTLAVLNRGVVT
ncbi:TetR/AcrR family transcriptional regulator [Mycolicibacterium pyrenivorans]|uniref:TetR/AcrR family transcriptional regulator n=1 Tax=Mycolicibacterium pyrenivorans TaxID=187102 RepID=UPI0021F3B04C|nr:helix-turn-helix domain-containing protein [Mycolicibacterium pyrenivorans]MCV7153910.1 helix-turn-helix transcriptional regulator [Mycolicibacterium pyrenivorans]